VGAHFELDGLHDEHRARAVLVGVDRGGGGWPIEDSLAELERLADTAGADVLGSVVQNLEKLNPRTFIGSGKADEVAGLVADLGADTVIFDDDLTPRQQANLEDHIPGARVLDRTALILDIFALHAESREGKLQVELAKLEYVLPRLRGMWGHLEAERLGGGRGARFGAGESQLEVDRRLTRRRISDLRKELKAVSQARDTQRKQRGSSGVFRVALVGYTNAGKSTLLNRLTGADVIAQDMLFATLDSTTRRIDLPDGRETTITDTVGFINKLPHGLVEAFKSTLDEVVDADLLLHIVDGAHPQAEAQMVAVDEVLHEIGADESQRMLVLNKSDIADPEIAAGVSRRHPDAIVVSASTGEGFAALLERISAEAAKGGTTMTVLLPYTRGELVQLAHERAHVVSERHVAEGTQIVVQASDEIVRRLSEFKVDAEQPETGEALP
jgi:GTP-binding protein HflX